MNPTEIAVATIAIIVSAIAIFVLYTMVFVPWLMKDSGEF